MRIKKTHPHHYVQHYDRIVIKIAKKAERFPCRSYNEVKRDIKNLQRAYNALMKYIRPTLEGYKLR